MDPANPIQPSNDSNDEQMNAPSADPMMVRSADSTPNLVTTPDNEQQQTLGQPTPGNISNQGKKKWLIPVIAGGILLVLLSAGYVFGIYMPNRPEAVFSTGLVRTGTAIDKLLEYTRKQSEAKRESTKLEGTLGVKSSTVSLDATIKSQSDGKNAKISLDANVAGQKLNVEALTVEAPSSKTPDVYLKVSGVKSYLEQNGGAQLAALDNQWIGVDHTLLDTLQKQIETTNNSSASLGQLPTAAQINDALAKTQKVNKEYLFTDNNKKAVLQNVGFVGKETIDGRQVYNYKVKLNHAQARDYIDALGRALDESTLNDWYKKQNNDQNISGTFEILKQGESKSPIAKDKADEIFNIRIDLKTKLVQSITFTSATETNPGTLTLSQSYTGGDIYPFALNVNMKDKENPLEITLGVVVNTKTNNVDLTVKGKNGSSSKTAFDFAAKMTPSDDKVTVTAPTGAKPITDVLKQLGLDPSMLNLPASSESTPSPLGR